MSNKKVLLVVAHEGYQPIEYGRPKEVLKAAGFEVETASNLHGAASTKDDGSVDVHLTVQEVNAADYEGIFFIGGPGAMEHLDNEHSYSLMRNTVNAHVPLGAICVSTRILAKAGVLKGKKATGWDADGELAGVFQEHGVNYVHEDVVVDGAIITAVGPDVAQSFGEEILALLQSNKGWG